MSLHRLSTAQVYTIYMPKYIQYTCPSIYNINAQVYTIYMLMYIDISLSGILFGLVWTL